MMNSWSLAARNLLRNRRRSLATLLALAIGSIATLLFGGYARNIATSMETAYIRAGGHLQIQHRDYFVFGSSDPTAYGIKDYRRLMDAIQADAALRERITVMSPTLQFSGVAGNFDQGLSKSVVGFGFVPQDVNAMRTWNEFDIPLDTPPIVLDDRHPDGAVIGMGVARLLQLCKALALSDCPQPSQPAGREAEADKPAPSAAKTALGADLAQLSDLEAGDSAQTQGVRDTKAAPRIELLAGHANGTPNVASLAVLAAELQGFKELDDVAVMLSLDQAQRLIYGRSPPRATAIMVQLQHTDTMAAVQARLQALIDGLKLDQPLTVIDYQTLNPYFVQTLSLFDTIFTFIFALIGSIVLFTVSNTVNTAVVERTVEIGTLRAMGLRRQQVQNLFVMEGTLLGVVGALGGLVASLVIAAIVNSLGLTWLPPGTSEPLPLVLRVWGETRMLAGATIGLVLIAVVSAWWPSRRAARLNVVESLRHT